MKPPVLVAKISKKIEERLTSELKTLTEHIIKGNLHAFETNLETMTSTLYNEIATEVLQSVSESESFESQLRSQAKSLRLGKLKLRRTRVQLKTGHYVEMPSLYATKVPPTHVGSRHLCHIYWRTIKGASPRYYSLISARWTHPFTRTQNSDFLALCLSR
jgi:hypothetical protein